MTGDRIRTRGPYYSGYGSRTKGTFTQSTAQKEDSYEYCDDTVGFPEQDHALILFKTKQTGTFNGSNGETGFGHRSCSNYASNRRLVGHLAAPGQGVGASATEAMARSNPSRAHVSLPNFIFEMGEIPRLVRNSGNRWFGQLGSENLKVQFGVLPFVSDLNKLFNFQTAVDRRMKELEALSSKGGLRRRISLQTGTLEEQEGFWMETYLFNCWSDAVTTTHRRSWAVLKWKPSSFQSPTGGKGHDARRKALHRQMLGLAGNQATQVVWNAIPWTWLIDWFVNVGNFLVAHNNSIATLAQPVNVMYHYHTVRTDRLSGHPGWVGAGDFGGTREDKQRYLSGGTLSATMPILTGRQLSILASLAALRL